MDFIHFFSIDSQSGRTTLNYIDEMKEISISGILFFLIWITIYLLIFLGGTLFW